MPLIGYAEAWSPPTAGVLTGAPIYIGDSTAIDIARLDERLRGAIVLTHRPQTEFLRADRIQPSDGNGPVQTGNPPLPGPSSATPTQQMLASSSSPWSRHRAINSYNVLAEIPGTDPALRDEVVLIGAHLDSWHTANGATDNGDGAIAAMEAMRILAALKVQPRRTIRVALWSGEEQGLLGARAYIAKYLPD